MKARLSALAVLMLSAATATAGTVGFQQVTVPDSDGKPREVGIDTSVPAAAWAHDARIKAAVIAAPTLAFTFAPQTLAPITVPVQLWRAGSDAITRHPPAAEAIYHGLPTRPDYVVVPDAGHFVFVACSAEMATRAPAVCQDVPGVDRTAFHQRFNAAVVAFFKAKLA